MPECDVRYEVILGLKETDAHRTSSEPDSDEG